MACWDGLLETIPCSAWKLKAEERFLAKELQRSQAKADALRYQHLQVELECLRLDNERQLKEATLAACWDDQAKLRDQVKKAEEEKDRLVACLERAQLECEEVEAARDRLLKQLEDSTEQLQRAEVELKRSHLDLETTREETQQTLLEAEAARNQIANGQLELQELQGQIAENFDKAVALRTQLHAARGESAQLAVVLKGALEGVAGLHAALTVMEDGSKYTTNKANNEHARTPSCHSTAGHGAKSPAAFTPSHSRSRAPSVPRQRAHPEHSTRTSRRTSAQSSASASARHSRAVSPDPRIATPTSHTPGRSGTRTPHDVQQARNDLETAQIKYGVDSKEALHAAANLALALEDARGTADEERSSNEEAGLLLRRVLAGFESLYGKEHADTLRAVNNLAVYLDNAGDQDGALALYRRAVTGRSRTLGPHSPYTLDSMYNLASFLWYNGHGKEAEEVFREAREGCLSTFGSTHHATLDCTERLVEILEARGEFTESEVFCRELLQGREEALGFSHPDVLSVTATLASLLASAGKPEAEGAYSAAVSRHEDSLGLDDPATLEVTYNFVCFLERNGRVEEAEEFLRKKLASCEQAFGANSAVALGYVDDLAILLEAAGRMQEAEVLFRRALDGRKRVLGGSHEDTLRSCGNLAVFLDNEGQGHEALDLYRQVLAERKGSLGECHPKTLESSYNLAVCLADQGETEEAFEVFVPLVQSLEEQLGPDSEWVLSCADRLGELLKETNRLQAAEVMFRRVYASRSAAEGAESSREAADAAYNLAICLAQQGRSDEAEPLFHNAIKSYMQAYSADDPYTLDAVFNLAACMEAQERRRDAELLYEVTRDGRRQVLGDDHQDTQHVESVLAILREAGAVPVDGQPPPCMDASQDVTRLVAQLREGAAAAHEAASRSADASE